VNATATYRELFNNDIVDQPLVDLALAETFDQRRAENREVVRQITRCLGLALAALTVETVGFASAAALAS
jgi:hypothetical protein